MTDNNLAIPDIQAGQILYLTRGSVETGQVRSPHFDTYGTLQSSSEGFHWPVQGPIISNFGQSAGVSNDGINIKVALGTAVKAVSDGIVIYAGNMLEGYGNLILIRHNINWVSAYAHNSRMIVKRGDPVRRGQILAKAGMTGSVSEPQVHFELRYGSEPVDPLKHLVKRR